MSAKLGMGWAIGLAVMVCSVAQADEWVLLGERKVNFDVERDTIPVDGAKLFQTIRLQAIGAPIRLLDLKVHFKNGDVQDVEVREDLAAGSYTRAIDLPGAARHIEKITMVYKTKARGPRVLAKAEMKVFGKQTGGAQPERPQPSPAPAAQTEWVGLGERKVNFGADQDVIEVTLSEGVFKRIRLAVEDNEIELWDLKVHFSNGDTQDVQVRSHLKAGSTTREIDLEGNNRGIKRVVLLYKSKLRPAKGRATVKLFGERVIGAKRGGGDEQPKPQPKQGGEWETLGSRQVDFQGDKDTIAVTAKEGRFSKLRLHVTGNKVHLQRIRVVFGNGEELELEVDKEIDAGQHSPALDLPGEKRVIQRVVFWYRSVGRGPRRMQPKATLTLSGLQ